MTTVPYKEIMKMHKFTYENTYQDQLPVKVEFTIPSDASLDDMCEEFTNYLKAIGYSIPNGEVLDFVPEDGYSSKGWDSFEPNVTDDFNPRGFDEYGNYGENNPPLGETKKKLWDATPEEWNNAYKNVTVTCNGAKFQGKE